MEAEGSDKQFICFLCGKKLCRNQRLQTHLKSKHNLEPGSVKRYKLYETDPNISIPKSTWYFRNKKFSDDCHLKGSESSMDKNGVALFENDLPEYMEETVSQDEDALSTTVNAEAFQEQIKCFSQTEQSCVMETNTSMHIGSGSRDILNSSVELESVNISNDANYQIDTENTYSADISLSPASENDSDTNTDTDLDSNSSDSEVENVQTLNENEDIRQISETEEKYMTILSYTTKHCLNGEAFANLLELFKIHGLSGEPSVSKIRQKVGTCEPKLFDFCSKCNTLFPDDTNVIQCVLQGCTGLRFKGGHSKQHLRQRKSYFACISVKDQLRDILQRKGVWEAVCQYRNSCQQSDSIRDIINGELYKKLIPFRNMPSNENHFSLLFNTDGVPLYNSSKISIWPVYLVINELPPVARFSRQNMILWGVWQSRGKPCFQTYFQPFVKDMINLRKEGILLQIQGKEVCCKFTLLAGTLDLQAKAMLLEMMHHNGEYACIACEEPGIVVKQGKGYARVFQYRENPAPERTSDSVLKCGLHASSSTRKDKNPHVKGIKGVSCLHGLSWFDVVYGIVPDYMHGVLLGTTKKMIQLMISSSSSKQKYFIGNHVKEIDNILTEIKPSDNISRLPRKLEDHLNNYKASELQMWLLFYSLPCLTGFLQPQYFDHLALLVEGIYILLGKEIVPESLRRAEYVLRLFYSQFEDLYGANNMTLNLHNIGQHLAAYVRKLGPLWAWSCFPFEDMNGSLLDHVHGTGDVCMQILWTLQAQKRLVVDSAHISNATYKAYVRKMTSAGRQIKIKGKATNCDIAGGMTTFIPNETEEAKLKNALLVDEIGKIMKVLRIKLGDQIIFSSEYTRMEKRISHVVSVNLETGKQMAVILHFVLHVNSNTCLAAVKEINACELDGNDQLHPSVKHLVNIDPGFDCNEISFIPVENITGKLLYISGNNCHCISQLPNLFGQCC